MQAAPAAPAHCDPARAGLARCERVQAARSLLLVFAGHPGTHMAQASEKHSQLELLRQRRFLPFFITQCFGAFNDNVYRQAIIGLLFWMGVSPEQRTLYTNLAPAIFILPYFLFSATAGQIAEKLEKSRLIRITTTMEIVIMSLAAVAENRK
jgi:hypothetical protein